MRGVGIDSTAACGTPSVALDAPSAIPFVKGSRKLGLITHLVAQYILTLPVARSFCQVTVSICLWWREGGGGVGEGGVGLGWVDISYLELMSICEEVMTK